MCVVSSSSSHVMATEGTPAVAGAMDPSPLGAGATTGGSIPRPGGGGGVRSGRGGGGTADDGDDGGGGRGEDETPSRVRFTAPGSGGGCTGGGGGVPCVRPGGRVVAFFFSRPSKTSRSDPPFSLTMARASCVCRTPRIHGSPPKPPARCDGAHVSARPAAARVCLQFAVDPAAERAIATSHWCFASTASRSNGRAWPAAVATLGWVQWA